jgi:pyruvate/2-oxoglutarate dehydrogenase complex dihydrolipoamide acyltransferase (E2) component
MASRVHISITNHDWQLAFRTPIINQPQCGILGVVPSERVVVIEDAIAIRPMVYLSRHSTIASDGATADYFLAKVESENLGLKISSVIGVLK